MIREGCGPAAWHASLVRSNRRQERPQDMALANTRRTRIGRFYCPRSKGAIYSIAGAWPLRTSVPNKGPGCWSLTFFTFFSPLPSRIAVRSAQCTQTAEACAPLTEAPALTPPPPSHVFFLFAGREPTFCHGLVDEAHGRLVSGQPCRGTNTAAGAWLGQPLTAPERQAKRIWGGARDRSGHDESQRAGGHGKAGRAGRGGLASGRCTSGPALSHTAGSWARASRPLQPAAQDVGINPRTGWAPNEYRHLVWPGFSSQGLAGRRAGMRSGEGESDGLARHWDSLSDATALQQRQRQRQRQRQQQQ
ncbi:hypothetical protein BS50DRAFT_663705 [Corynespora cassiicola Philippines]|uniref:Uncharacterized protein n=1 Tax=Corynespora cassiicola Philippines TaxID=1448308 RepID=A0A2T2NV09_CORCC|nr:hypothetical protein BS50DRAFT_663705 [Corynespora cassiicola Philippines]